MFTFDRSWVPIGLTATVALLINSAFFSATMTPIAASASVSTSTVGAHAPAVDQAALAQVAPLTDRPQESAGTYQADAGAELSAIEVARLTTRLRPDAAAEADARAQTQRAARQAATEQAATEQADAEQAAKPRAASHTHESAPAATSAPADDYHARAERAADAMPFDWRANGITFKVGCHPDQSRCSWGTFDYRVNEVWLSSAAFASDDRLRYVVAHELAHAWQWSTNRDDRKADLIEFGVSTSDGIEYGADCVAEAWGHPVATYWDCPSDAVAHMRSVFAAAS